MLTSTIDSGQRAGDLRDGDPAVIARALLLATHGFVLSAHTMVDDRVELEDLDAVLAVLVERAVTT